MTDTQEMEPTDSRATAEPSLTTQMVTILSMDPRLQRFVAQRRSGTRRAATSSTARDEVAVLAKVSNLTAWEALSEVQPGYVMGDVDASGNAIVTARIPIARIEAVRQQPFVKSMKAAQKLHRTLAATTDETLARPAALPPAHATAGGKGVLVGIIDYGCDFAHHNFLDANGKTRVLKIWDQGGNAGNGPLQYGTLYDKAAINAALAKPDPYKALGYGPSTGDPAHGTHVMDIAAGNGRGTKIPGMAPAADIVFVEVDDSDVPWEGVGSVGHSFGDSVRLLDAAKFIFDEAGVKPCVINISLGTNGGPHDGTTLFEQGLDRLLQQKDNRAVVIAASNSYDDGIHQSGRVAAGGKLDLEWEISAEDSTENELEVWYAKGRKLACELIQPGGKSLGRINPGEAGSIKDAHGNLVIFISNRLKDPNNGDNVIGVWTASEQVAGVWKLRLIGDAAFPTDFHAWIERDDDGQSSFMNKGDQTHTIGSISCGKESIVVGSYDAHKASVPLSWFSSEGPTRDGRQKPEVSAPGEAVRAAASRSKIGVTKMSGTSMASPATTGMVALLFAAAKARGISLNIAKTRKLVIDAARKNPPGGAWHSRYGFGRISAAGAIAALIASHAVPAAKGKTKLKNKAAKVARTKPKTIAKPRK